MSAADREATRRALIERMARERAQALRRGGINSGRVRAVQSRIRADVARAEAGKRPWVNRICYACGSKFRTRSTVARVCSYVCAGGMPAKSMNVRRLPLLTGARPVPCGPDASAESRRLLCRGYDACLTHASAEGWAGFSCARCNVRDALPADRRNG